MKNNYREVSEKELKNLTQDIANKVNEYIAKENIKIDYICPILRSGAVPAVYISNELNVIKFAPIQVKHIAYKNGKNTIEMIFNPFENLKVNKEEPVFLLVEALQSTGTSVEICIDEIKKKYPKSKILYVCLVREFKSRDFKENTDFSYSASYYKGDNNFTEEECRKLNIDYQNPLFPWEILESKINHPDDLEENIFF